METQFKGPSHSPSLFAFILSCLFAALSCLFFIVALNFTPLFWWGWAGGEASKPGGLGGVGRCYIFFFLKKKATGIIIIFQGRHFLDACRIGKPPHSYIHYIRTYEGRGKAKRKKCLYFLYISHRKKKGTNKNEICT